MLNDDIDRGLLHDSEGFISVNMFHPKVRPAIDALRDLRSFVEGDTSQEFQEAYEAENEDEFSFTTRGFWERHLF